MGKKNYDVKITCVAKYHFCYSEKKGEETDRLRSQSISSNNQHDFINNNLIFAYMITTEHKERFFYQRKKYVKVYFVQSVFCDRA